MVEQIFSAVRDGRVPLYDLLLLGAGGTLVSATAARIATHAYAMPPATQPAVTQASQTPFGCRMLDGQVHCDEDHRGGGLLAGRVALDYTNSLTVLDSSLFDREEPARTVWYARTALLRSLAWDGTHEHARDRGRSAGDGPILEHAQDSQHG